ncbi:hypothetical protein PG993_013685 [Apiospora rasikravindrae]|uniref:DUF7587 domain-containing protein n=1 Tax=Apiospora rasikravindrae TaxID=990691 RepID=A0ABR1RS38_9PEZI
MDLNHFTSISVESMSRRLGDHQSLPSTVPNLARLQHPEHDQNQPAELEQESLEVERRLKDIIPQNSFLLLLLNRLNSAILELNSMKLVPNIINRHDSEELFYRYHRNPTHKNPSQSLWKPDLGIVCPGWRKHGSAGFEVTQKHVQQHLTDGDTSYPPFISVSDNPARVHKIMSNDDLRTEGSATIIIISPSILWKLRINYQRSTDLVRGFGLNPFSSRHPNGVHYATESHWMVLRWIPAECIVGEMGISQFESFCTTRGV